MSNEWLQIHDEMTNEWSTVQINFNGRRPAITLTKTIQCPGCDTHVNDVITIQAIHEVDSPTPEHAKSYDAD
jgi:hypothetical protein